MQMLFVSMFVASLLSFGRAEQNKLAEGHVPLTRVHPVVNHNFPDVTDSAVAAMLIQTHESRVPHYQVKKLREAHSVHRAPLPGSMMQISGNPVRSNRAVLSDGTVLSENVASSAKTGLSGPSIRMTNLRDSQYVGPLRVGSQGDILSVVYDTGSTNLWFASTLCTEGSCLRRRRYDPASSKSFHSGDFDLHVTFGTGELSGSQGIDDVEMAGFKVKQQTFAMIEVEKGTIFDQLDFEGILGLAFPKMSANSVPPFFDQVMQQKLLKTNAFSFFFTKLPKDASAVFFGEVDPRLHQGELINFPVTEEYYWIVDLKHFKINGKIVDGPKKVVFDTGTTYYTAPSSLLPIVLAQMPQSKCEGIRTGTSSAPDMSFTLLGHNGEEHELVMKPSEYFVSSGFDGLCDPAWMPIDVPSPYGPAWIFGEAFMRTFFTSFHRGDGTTPSQVKIARQNSDASALVEALQKEGGMSENQKRLSLLEDSTRHSESTAPMSFMVQSQRAEYKSLRAHKQ